MARLLRRALRERVPGPPIVRGRLSVAYQVIRDLPGGRVVGVEALARLRDDQQQVAPSVFIPVAEQTGLIAALGRYVLDTACADLAGWHARHPQVAGVGVSVNVSARQADLTDLAGEVRRALDRTGLAPGLLTLELTETETVPCGHAAVTALHDVRGMGVQVVLDDFGTGHAGLDHLARLPVTGVKVDRSFTAGLPHDPVRAAIVGGIIGLARELGLSCVVEGIETPGQRRALPPGVRGQGFLLGRPTTAQQLIAHHLAGWSVGGGSGQVAASADRLR